MRVLHINAGNMYGGVETFLVTLAREAQAAPDMESEFGLCFEGRFSAELEALGRSPHLLGHVKLSRPQTVLRARRALTALLRRETFDVVVCHQPWTCVVFASAIRAAGFPVVLWVHMAGEGRDWLERLARLARPELAICNSRFSASCVSRWLDRAPLEQVYYPVSFPKQFAADAQSNQRRREFDTDESDTVVVQVSRLEGWKGHRVLLSALSQLCDLPAWTCWVVGGAQRRTEADYLLELKEIARRAGIEARVRFVGERRDVLSILKAADVFCQPNTSPEPFGLSLVEAMHAGLPVVTSGIGGACEIVDGSCGILTPPADVSALACALRRLIVERDLRLRLGAEARRRPDALCQIPRQMCRIQTVLASVATRSVTQGHAIRANLR